MKRIPAVISSAVVLSAVGVFSLGTLISGGFAKLPSKTPALHQPFLHAQQSLSLALGQDCVNGIFITDDRLILQHESYANHIVNENVAAVNAYAQRSTAPLYWLVAPTAAGIYADTLPVGAPQASELTMMNKAMEQLDPAIAWVDVNSSLYGARDSYLYCRTDRRWTTDGAFYAYKAAIRKLGLSNLGRDRFVITNPTTDFRGDLYDISGCNAADTDTMELFTCADAPKITSILGVKSGKSYTSFYQPDQTEPFAVFLPETEPVIQAETEVHNKKRIVVLCDEYGSNFVPFLTAHFRSMTVVNIKTAEPSDIPTVSDDGNTQILLLCSADTLAKSQGLSILNATTES